MSSGENKQIDIQIDKLQNAANWDEFVKIQQELLRNLFARIQSLESSLILNNKSDLHELYRTDALAYIKEQIQEETNAKKDKLDRFGRKDK